MEDLANAAAQSASQYLIVRQLDPGPLSFDARMENLLGMLEDKLSEANLVEIFWRFRDNPTNNVAIKTFRIHLAEEINNDPEFAKELRSALGGKMANKSRRRKVLAVTVALVASLVLLGIFFLGRATQPAPVAQPAPTTTVTSYLEPTTTVAPTTTTTTASSSFLSSSSPPSSRSSAVAGDGSALNKGEPVYLTELPRPNNDWNFSHGDHDVQLTQYGNSLWNELVTCYESSRSRAQQFRLKNFSTIEVKAVGTDSTSDPDLVVKFEIFVNNDNVNPIASVVVGAGETKQMKADLPANVFSLTLRTSLERANPSKCLRGNAVWGSPYVVAAGS